MSNKEQAKSEFLRAKDAMVKALEATPDDRINWSPASSARTPLHQVAHAAVALGNMHGTMMGTHFDVPSSEEADKLFRDGERCFTTREAVLDLLERNSQAFLIWLDAATPEQLDRVVKLPFGMGDVPASVMLPFMASHLNWHTAQIHYTQTIYGDHDWHF